MGGGKYEVFVSPSPHRCGGFSVSSARRTLLPQQVASPCRRVYPPKVDPSRINFIPNLGATQVRVNRYCRWYEMMDLSSGCCIVPTPLYGTLHALARCAGLLMILSGQASQAVSSWDLPSQTTLKFRKGGQNSEAELRKRDVRAEVEESERRALDDKPATIARRYGEKHGSP